MRTLWIAVGAFFAGALALLLVAVGIGWYITDGPGAGPSIDQQQQAWEQDTEREACDAYKRLGGAESFKLGDALDTLAGKEQGETATIQLDLPGCLLGMLTVDFRSGDGPTADQQRILSAYAQILTAALVGSEKAPVTSPVMPKGAGT